MVLLDKAIIAGKLRVDHEPFQMWLHRALDDHRRGGASFAAANGCPEPRTADVIDDGGELVLLDGDDGDDSDDAGVGADIVALARVTWQPLGADHRLNVGFGDAFPVGPPAAPLALRIARLADERWQAGLADLTPALSL